MAAPGEVKPCDGQPNGHGIGQPSDSAGTEPTLSVLLMALLQRLDALIDQNAQLIEMMLDEPEQADDEQPSRYLNGSRIS